jgi:hypothetical protein
MITLEPIDPFLRELRLAQATGQRVLAAAAQRRPTGATLRRGASHRADAVPSIGRGAGSAAPSEQRAD